MPTHIENDTRSTSPIDDCTHPPNPAVDGTNESVGTYVQIVQTIQVIPSKHIPVVYITLLLLRL